MQGSNQEIGFRWKDRLGVDPIDKMKNWKKGGIIWENTVLVLIYHWVINWLYSKGFIKTIQIASLVKGKENFKTTLCNFFKLRPSKVQTMSEKMKRWSQLYGIVKYSCIIFPTHSETQIWFLICKLLQLFDAVFRIIWANFVQLFKQITFECQTDQTNLSSICPPRTTSWWNRAACEGK